MASPICDDFKLQDLGAYDHCREWLPDTESREKLDVGTTHTDYADDHQPAVIVDGAGDGTVSVQEYLQWVIDGINKNPADHKMAESLAAKTGIRIPYLFTDYNPETDDDALLEARIAGLAAKLKNRTLREGFKEGTAEYLDLAAKKMAEMLGRDLEVNPYPPEVIGDPARNVTRNAIDTVLAGGGNCMGLSNLDFGVFLYAGLVPQVYSVEWDKNGQSIIHRRIGFPLDADKGGYYAFDRTMWIFGASPPGEVTVPISDLDFIAQTYVNLLLENPKLSLAERRELLMPALKLAPHNYQVLVEAARYYNDLGQLKRAGRFYKAALAVYPGTERKLREMFPRLAKTNK